MQKILPALVVFLLLSACVGEDVIDDLQIPNLLRITLTAERQSLLPGQQLQLAVAVASTTGAVPNPTVDWEIDNPALASIDEQGLLQAIAPGQVAVRARKGLSVAEPYVITIVADEDAVASVQISGPAGFDLAAPIPISQFVALTATARNINGELVPGLPVAWSSDDPATAVVSAEGLVQGLRDGMVNITATVSGITSDPLTLMIGEVVQIRTRMGTFSSSGGYTTRGTATLIQEGNQLRLELSEDFETDFALGTFIYLSNSSSGSSTFSSGLEIADISRDLEGARTFDISQVDPSIDLDSFDYVVVLCRPARISFGSAQLSN